MAGRTAIAQARLRDPAYQVFLLLRTGFTVAPILMGVDKFFNWMVDWPEYLAGWVNSIFPGTAQQFMYGVGVVEILAGVMVLLAPRFGALVVAGWLGAIIVNLLTKNPPDYYDIALRDVGLLVGAVALARLAWAFRHAPQAHEVLAPPIRKSA
jgi:uncharacterized membrane protein YphA (DoxX/SURF4 family)